MQDVMCGESTANETDFRTLWIGGLHLARNRIRTLLEA